MIPISTPFQWGLAVCTAPCIGLTKSGVGGFGLLIVSLMTMILPAKESTGAVLPLLITAVAVGFLLGKAVLGRISQEPFDLMLLIMSLAAAVKLAFS